MRAMSSSKEREAPKSKIAECVHNQLVMRECDLNVIHKFARRHGEKIIMLRVVSSGFGCGVARTLIPGYRILFNTTGDGMVLAL